MRSVASWLFLTLAIGCDDGTSGGPAQPGADAGGDTGNACDYCPDPADPRVHYLSQDPNACIGVVLMCTAAQNGFQGTCGCGCIDKGDPMCPACDDPSIEWISTDPRDCAPEPPACSQGRYGFSNTCGCGCVLPG